MAIRKGSIVQIFIWGTWTKGKVLKKIGKDLYEVHVQSTFTPITGVYNRKSQDMIHEKRRKKDGKD